MSSAINCKVYPPSGSSGCRPPAARDHGDKAGDGRRMMADPPADEAGTSRPAQLYDFARLCRRVGHRAVGAPRLLELGAQIAPTALVAEATACRPDRLRPDAKRTQQAGQFGLRQLAWRSIDVAPFVSEIVFQSEQCFDQGHARNAIDPERLEHGPNISKQDDAGVFVREIGAESPERSPALRCRHDAVGIESTKK